MLRTLALAAATALPLAAATLSPVSALDLSLRIDSGDVEPVGWRDRPRWDGHPRGDWHRGGPWRHRGHGYHYGPPRHAFAPACTVRAVRFWDGWNWVVERRRVCN